jgi:hypothetical protein
MLAAVAKCADGKNANYISSLQNTNSQNNNFTNLDPGTAEEITSLSNMSVCKLI